jgi:hypothetical protein
MPVASPVVISIDGMGADPQGSNAGPFLSLPADDIATIVITKGYIGITTRGISRTREAYLESGILQYNHPAYTKARTFYTPPYPATTQGDLRTAVAWEPQVQFDPSGQAWIPFTTATVPGKYQVKIEGISASGQTIVEDKIVTVRF